MSVYRGIGEKEEAKIGADHKCKKAAIGFEPMNNGFADRRLTPWLCRHERNGAGNGTRTRDINLGKVALYQLSYSRFFVIVAKTPKIVKRKPRTTELTEKIYYSCLSLQEHNAKI